MAQARPFFECELRPNPVLGPQGMRAVFIVAVGFSLFISVGFFAVGAWPVLGFFGLDILGLYWAFHIVRKRAERREWLRLDRQALTLHRQSRAQDEWQEIARLEPTWARVECRVAPTIGSAGGEVTVAHLLLCSHGQAVECGAFLPVPEKRKIADDLTRALRDRAAQPLFNPY
ncbi:MAG: DUF2244 domain-containing protein [Alphaproteobacteria bacterium]